jgi:hypothetical protein
MSGEVFLPQKAPLSRKLLALRVIAASALTLLVAGFFMGQLDSLKLNLPEWLEFVFALPFMAAFVGFIASLVHGGSDLVVHWVPPGRIRKLLLSGNRSPEQIATEFEQLGYHAALFFLYGVVGIIAIALFAAVVLLILTLGFSVIHALAGWPSWAIVITFLLILLLIKK